MKTAALIPLLGLAWGLRLFKRNDVDIFDTATTLNVEALLEEDRVNERNKDEAPRYAVAREVDLSIENSGTWEEVDGTRVWTLQVTSEGAVSLNLGFTTYRMTEGATLVVYSTDGERVIRPFTADDNADHGQLWTPPVEGDALTIEVQVPEGVEEPELHLTQIGVGYRPFGEPLQTGGIASGSCNVDVVCSEGDAWRDEIRSVAVISTGGRTFCTGFMVNNLAQDGSPLFMTAHHCRIRSNSAPSLVTFWNYENSRCRRPGSSESGRPGDGSLDQFNTGSTLLASNADSDFTIVRLSRSPDPAWNVYYAGWDARPGDFDGVVAIHHPATDEKRISFENDRTATTTYLGRDPRNDGTHVWVKDWDLGTTEGGSSGSPLFSLERRVVGQLHGGRAACGNDLSDWYGRISVSWEGDGTQATRLRDHLDPNGTGELFVDGSDF